MAKTQNPTAASRYFDGVRKSLERARTLASIATTVSTECDGVGAMRYDRPETGHAKGGAVSIDALDHLVSRLDDTRARAEEAKVAAAESVNECAAVLVHMAETPDADVKGVAALHAYYLRGYDDEAVSRMLHVGRSAACKIRRRGLVASEPYLAAAGLI